MKKIFLITLLIHLFVSAASANAIHYDPFDTGWLKGGTNSLMLYSVYGGANKLKTNGETSVRNLNYEERMGIMRLSTWRDIASTQIFLSVVAPFGSVSMDPFPAPGAGSASASGIGDFEFIASVRTLSWQNGYINVGASVTAPTGAYDHNSYMNMGNNRWSLKGLVGIVQDISSIVHLEMWLGYEYYTDNDRYGAFKHTLSKEDVFFSEIHATHVFIPESFTYAGVSIGGVWGGKEKSQSAKSNDTKDISAKITVATNITETFSITFNYAHDILKENGPKGYQAQLRFAKYF